MQATTDASSSRASPSSARSEDDRASRVVRELLTALREYWEDVHRWWTALFGCFKNGGDLAALKESFLEERLIERLDNRLHQVRSRLVSAAAILGGLGRGLDEGTLLPASSPSKTKKESSSDGGGRKGAGRYRDAAQLLNTLADLVDQR